MSFVLSLIGEEQAFPDMRRQSATLWKLFSTDWSPFCSSPERIPLQVPVSSMLRLLRATRPTPDQSRLTEKAFVWRSQEQMSAWESASPEAVLDYPWPRFDGLACTEIARLLIWRYLQTRGNWWREGWGARRISQESLSAFLPTLSLASYRKGKKEEG